MYQAARSSLSILCRAAFSVRVSSASSLALLNSHTLLPKSLSHPALVTIRYPQVLMDLISLLNAWAAHVELVLGHRLFKIRSASSWAIDQNQISLWRTKRDEDMGRSQKPFMCKSAMVRKVPFTS